MTTSEILSEYLGSLRDLPCWGVRHGFGSFLTFNFGEPHLNIREANPTAKLASRKRRRVRVRGEFYIWIEQCEWYILVNGKEVAWSESDDATISKAVYQLDSQKLQRILLDFEHGAASFIFESNGELSIQRYDDFREKDSLWHLFSRNYAVSQLAGGHLQYGPSDKTDSRTILADNFHMNLA